MKSVRVHKATMCTCIFGQVKDLLLICFCICRFKLAFGEIAAVLAGTRFEVICSLLRLAVLAT